MQIRHLDRYGAYARADLFGTFAALARDEVVDFPALRAHQRHSWHTFTVQCAALALQRAGASCIPETTEDWRGLLLGLTPEHPDGAAWALIVENWESPALLQPPGMEFQAKAKEALTPDGLDMLLTARNHDLKSARIVNAEDDDWLFALVSLQTQEGQMGVGNYGISRMNGGFGARVGFSLKPVGDRPGAAFRRDLERLLELRPLPSKTGKIGLVWLEPWDGTSSIPFGDLDPYYVEICRRVRLVRENGRIKAILATSRTSRIETKGLKGKTGDPWAPVDRVAGKSWGITERGFGYRQMVVLLNREVMATPLAMARPADGPEELVLQARAVARGQGKTEGYHERSVPIPPHAVSLFTKGNRVAEVAMERHDAVREAAGILRHALWILAQGGPYRLRRDDPVIPARIAPFEGLFETGVDQTFFDAAFWSHALETDDAVDHLAPWRIRLRDLGMISLEAAETTLARSQMRRIRAKSRARSVFHGRMRRYLDPGHMPATRENDHVE